jgi:hypothetical protein
MCRDWLLQQAQRLIFSTCCVNERILALSIALQLEKKFVFQQCFCFVVDSFCNSCVCRELVLLRQYWMPLDW